MVYFIQNVNTKAVKIGTSRDPARRIAGFQTAVADTLEMIGILPGDRRTERDLHSRFAPYRLRGEWFSGEPDVINGIRAILRSADRRMSVEDASDHRDGCDFGLIGLYVSAIDGESILEIVGTHWGSDGRLVLTLDDGRQRPAYMFRLRSFWPQSFERYEGGSIVLSHGGCRDVTINGHMKPVGMEDDEFRQLLTDAGDFIGSRLTKFFREKSSTY